MPHLPKVLRFSLPNNPQTHKSYAGPVVITCYFLPSFNLSGNNTASLIICPLIFDTHASALIEYYGYLSYLETIFIAMIHHLYLEGITVSFYPFESDGFQGLACIAPEPARQIGKLFYPQQGRSIPVAEF